MQEHHDEGEEAPLAKSTAHTGSENQDGKHDIDLKILEMKVALDESLTLLSEGL